MRKLDGKIALVTGASKGIGAGIALSLAKEGAAVAMNYASDREGADRVVEKIKAAGAKAIAVQGNVTSPEEIDRFFNETEKQLGDVDVLVNNAGVFAYLPLQDINEKDAAHPGGTAKREQVGELTILTPNLQRAPDHEVSMSNHWYTGMNS
jgi:3-oxoacyl-[acyl-carrier protein] reductase